jgi:hypothetical protein
MILAAFAAYLYLFHRSWFRARWRALALAGVVAAGLALPLALAATPGGEERLAVVGQPLLDLLRGDPRYALRNTAETLGMFAFTGDPEFLYNIPGRPVFGWLGALLFAGGVALCLWRWRDPRHAFLLLWLLGGLAPAFVSTPAASLGHTIAAQPAVYVFPALALRALGRGMGEGRPQRAAPTIGRAGVAVLAALYLGLVAVRDVPDYFVRWPALPQVRLLYRADLHDAAPALRALPAGSDLALGSPALHAADALALALETPGRDLRPRVYVPARAWLFPAEDVPALLPAAAGAGPFASAPPEGASYVLRPARLETGAQPAVPLAAAFANGWTCLGYTLHDASDGATASLTMDTYWRVEAGYAPPAPRPVEVLSGTPLPLRFFAHALAGDGTVLAGDDRLDVDPAALRPGDTFIQRFVLELPGAPGRYPVQVGIYDPAGGTRVPLEDGGDALRLAEVSVP